MTKSSTRFTLNIFLIALIAIAMSGCEYRSGDTSIVETSPGVRYDIEPASLPDIPPFPLKIDPASLPQGEEREIFKRYFQTSGPFPIIKIVLKIEDPNLHPIKNGAIGTLGGLILSTDIVYTHCEYICTYDSNGNRVTIESGSSSATMVHTSNLDDTYSTKPMDELFNRSWRNAALDLIRKMHSRREEILKIIKSPENVNGGKKSDV